MEIKYGVYVYDPVIQEERQGNLSHVYEEINTKNTSGTGSQRKYFLPLISWIITTTTTALMKQTALVCETVNKNTSFYLVSSYTGI